MMKKGFTLLEVLLSVAAMSAGVLTVVILYSLGFRETRQSREDVASAAYADAVMSPIVNALSATNLSWRAFRQEFYFPNDTGWAAYMDENTSQVVSDPEGTASGVISSLKGVLTGVSGVQWPTLGGTASAGLKAGLVITHEAESTVVKIGFRATRNPKMLMSAPLYYTEVHFQGDPTK